MLGERIKHIRKSKSLSQQAFATKLATTSGYISEVENGKTMPGSAFLCSLKREFPEVDLNWLMTGVGQTPEEKMGALADPKIQKVVAIMERLDDSAKADLVKQAEKEELVEQIKHAKGLKPLGEAGLIGLNFLVQLLLPAEVILVAVGYGVMDGPTGRELLSYLPYLWMMAIAAFIVYPVEAVRYLKHRCCTLVRLRSWHLGS